ncbi:MAG: hypothetical protein LBF97_05890 [Elusimicrobiota bacterium]|jgi:hypothetical protein|nr:hypothetical protein [Elusimicrobiota bacterium]
MKIENPQKKIFKIFISGWATDYKIFDIIYKKLIKKKHDFFFSEKIIINEEFFNEICNKIQNKKKSEKNIEIEIISWSMGCFIVIDILKKIESENLQIFKNIVQNLKLNLWSICEFYDKKDIEQIKKFILKNKNLYLEKFYEKCFFCEKKNSVSKNFSLSNYKKFKLNYQNYYFEKFNIDTLFNGLDYLKKSVLDTDFILKLANYGAKIRIVNSKNDKIINKFSNNILDLNKKNKNIKIEILDNCGHMFFLERKDIMSFLI